jgi:5-formyltetrahydrofolate cyclo-ligase
MLPPFGENANGYPYRKWQITWGLKDPENGRFRPFASSMTSEKRCPITEYVEALSKKAESLKSNLKAQGQSDAQIKAELKDINAVISNLRPKTVYVYNAINKSGEVGLLEIKSTAHKKLKTLMMEYISDYNQDPTSLNSAEDDSGVWFNISRTGEGFDTEYDVAKNQHKQKVNGQLVFADDRSAIAENVVENYDKMAYDLGSIYQVKSYDELKDILLANLREISQEVPDAIVEGFDDFENAPEIAASEQDEDQKPVAKAASKTTSNVKGSTKVNINLDDEDEEVDEAPVRASTKTNGLKKTASKDEDDVFAMADQILNG